MCALVKSIIYLALSTFFVLVTAHAQDGGTANNDPEMTALQQQNSVLEQRLRLASQERTLTKLSAQREDLLTRFTTVQPKDDASIENLCALASESMVHTDRQILAIMIGKIC